jgi:hypothetical protein
MKDIPNFQELPLFYKKVIESWYICKNNTAKRPKHFRDIRRQVIWGNENILLKNKPLWFQHWIDSGIIYINDMLDNLGIMNAATIRNKLTVKANWISELFRLKEALPNSWNSAITCDESRATHVYIQHHLTLSVDFITIPFTAGFDFKLFYKQLIERKYERPYILMNGAGAEI